MAWGVRLHMGGCQDYGPFLDPYYNKAQKGIIILTSGHMTNEEVWKMLASSN